MKVSDEMTNLRARRSAQTQVGAEVSFVTLTLTPALPMNRPNRREVLECDGWRGMALTPLFASARTASAKAVCAPNPSPTALQDAGAPVRVLAGSRAQIAVVRPWSLSLRERENHPPTPTMSRAGEKLNDFGAKQRRQRLFPLPAGEGQGEGEPLNHHVTLKFL